MPFHTVPSHRHWCYVLNQQIQFPAISFPSLCVIPFMIKLLLFKRTPCSKIVQLLFHSLQHTITWFCCEIDENMSLMQNVTGKADRKHGYWNSSTIWSMPIRHCHPHAVASPEIWWETKASIEVKNRNMTCKPDFCSGAKKRGIRHSPHLEQWDRRSSVESLVLLQCEAVKQPGKAFSSVPCVLQELLAAGAHLLTVALLSSNFSIPAEWEIWSQL